MIGGSFKINMKSRQFWLRLVRWLLLGYAVLLFTVSVTGILLFPEYARLHAEEFTPNDAWSSAQVQTGLEQLGLPPTVPAYVDLWRTLLLLVVGFSLGLVLLWRAAHSWFILYLAFIMLSMTGGDATFLPVISRFPALAVVNNFLSGAAWQLFFILFFFFPNGKAVPGWTRWLTLIWVISIAITPFLPATIQNHPLTLPLYLALVTCSLASQIYRYFRHSQPVERQQTKWVVASVGLMLVFFMLIVPWAFEPPSRADLGFPLMVALVIFFLLNTTFAMVPLSIGMAVLKKGLWEIDLVIRRTLIWGIITAVLVLAYLGCVTLLQRIITDITGQQSPLAIVLSTLLIASLFQPLRRAAQNAVDRRFFRGQYDARRTLASFTQIASKEVEFERITGALTHAVEETLQPEQVSLWMKTNER